MALIGIAVVLALRFVNWALDQYDSLIWTVVIAAVGAIIGLFFLLFPPEACRLARELKRLEFREAISPSGAVRRSASHLELWWPYWVVAVPAIACAALYAWFENDYGIDFAVGAVMPSVLAIIGIVCAVVSDEIVDLARQARARALSEDITRMSGGSPGQR